MSPNLVPLWIVVSNFVVPIEQTLMSKFIRRQSNEVVHELDKTTTYSASFCIFDEIPTCITDLNFNEMI